MKIKFYGAAKTVTGSSYLVDTGKYRFLVDCGMFQGEAEIEERNNIDYDFNPKDLDFVVLTHAHLDHSGLLPKLVNQGFRGKIYLTKPTNDLAQLVLLDSAKVQLIKHKESNKKKHKNDFLLIEDDRMKAFTKLLYTDADTYSTISKFEIIETGKTYNINEDIKATFIYSGHILGAVSALIEVDGVRFAFSGDIGHDGQDLMDPPNYISQADYVFVESTYGDRYHPPKQESIDKLFDAIEETIRRGGNVIIPSFAVQRTQEMLYMFKKRSIENGFNTPVYLDSPMAMKATQIYQKYSNEFNKSSIEFQNVHGDLFSYSNIHFVSDISESYSLKRKTGMIIIAGSGMCTGGRVLMHLKNNITNKNNSVLFVGYQAIGTLGREISDGASEVVIDSRRLKVRAHIKLINGFSAHADKLGIMKWIGGFKGGVKKVFLIHGEEDQLIPLKDSIEKTYGYGVHIPFWKEEVEL